MPWEHLPVPSICPLFKFQFGTNPYWKELTPEQEEKFRTQMALNQS